MSGTPWLIARIAVVLVLSFWILPNISPAAQSPKDYVRAAWTPMIPMRALWVQYEDANSPSTADATIERASAAGFDTIILLVGSGEVSYDSDLLPDYSTALCFDPLEYVIEKAHDRGMKVQAWWCPGRLPEDSQFRKLHPTWDIAADPRIPDDVHWLNFALPEVRSFVADAVVEIATRYRVDGVHLDYIRYPAPPPYGPLDSAQFFGDDDIPNTVRITYQKLKSARPDVELTAAVLDSPSSSAQHLQGWVKWLEGGYIDRVMPMAYYGPQQDNRLKKRIAEWMRLPGAERIVPGLSIAVMDGNEAPQIKSGPELLRQIDVLQSYGFGSLALFDSTTLTDDLIEYLAQPKP